MYFKIDNPNEYTDNRFGMLIASCIENTQDIIIVFKDHVIALPFSEYKNGIFGGYGFKITSKEEDGFLVIDEKSQYIFSAPSYKYIGFEIMKYFRQYYTEYKLIDFPINELKFKAVGDMEDCLITKEEL